MQLYSGAPFWLVSDGLTRETAPLERAEQCDVAIVGAGITGALIAETLTGAGLDVVVLEQRLPGIGSTAASTALLQYEVDVELNELIERVGLAAAVRAYALGVGAISYFERLVADIGDDCGFSRRPSVYLASRRRHVRRLKRECATRMQHGFDVEWWDGTRITGEYGVPSFGAVWSAEGGQIDALRLTRRLLERVRQRGGRVYARTAVSSWTAGGAGQSPISVLTDRGQRVSTRYLVFATGYDVPPTMDRGLVQLHSTYAIVTEPLVTKPPWHGQCLIWESARPYFYMRGTDDGRILAGGEDVPFRSPATRDVLLPRKTGRLTRRLGEVIPGTPFDVAFSWAGTFAETADGLPYIGPTAASPSVLVALGYGGNGITFSAIAAQIVSDLCRGCPDSDSTLFRLDRTSP